MALSVSGLATSARKSGAHVGRGFGAEPRPRPDPRRRGAGALRVGRQDTEENHLAVCLVRETVEYGLRLGAVGNLVTITVLI